MNVSQVNTFISKQNKNCAQKTLNFRAKYKTEKCRYLIQRGYCPYGDMCAFAHDFQEMRNKAQLHSQYKTKPCYCKYGDRCLFLHTSQRDRERTRSNSLQENEKSIESNMKMRHSINLKILSDFGLSVFEAYMNRKESRVLSWPKYSHLEQTTASESESQLNENHPKKNLQWSIRWQDQLINAPPEVYQKKPRMYSL